MPYIDQPTTSAFDSYEWPAIRRLGWSVNRSAHVVCGNTVRPAGDYPCDPPYPCTPPGPGAAWTPGRHVPITLHPCRARQLIAHPDVYPNTEVCRRHYGRWTMNRRGRMQPIICSIPDEYEHRVHASYGYVTCRGADERPTSDLLSLVRYGRFCAIAQVDLPETGEALIENTNPSCDIPR
jgi:hypothetical protein